MTSTIREHAKAIDILAWETVHHHLSPDERLARIEEHAQAILHALNHADVPIRWHNERGTQDADFRMRLIPDPESDEFANPNDDLKPTDE
jgi:hypothetical protein